MSLVLVVVWLGQGAAPAGHSPQARPSSVARASIENDLSAPAVALATVPNQLPPVQRLVKDIDAGMTNGLAAKRAPRDTVVQRAATGAAPSADGSFAGI